LDTEPNNFHAMETLGRVRYKQGKTRQALEYLETAARINSEDIHVFYYLGLIQEKLGLLDEAEISFATALKKNQDQKVQAGDEHETLPIENGLG